MSLIEKLFFWIPSTVASVYDAESLTAQELAAKAAGKVNECIDKVNENTVHIQNLDAEITTVVDNKLDALANDGTLETLINGSLFANLNNQINVIDDKVDVNTSSINTANGKIQALEGDNTTNKAQLSNLNEQMTDVIADVSENTSDIATINGVISDLTGDTSANTTSLKNQLLSMVVNVKFPPTGYTAAVGNGVADDTAAIQALLNYVGSNGGGIVFLPKGNYLISNRLEITYSNVCLMGVGGSVINQSTNNISLYVHTAGIKNVTLKNFEVNGNSKGQASAGVIQLNDVTNFMIDGLIIHDAGNASDGIVIAMTATKGVVQNCHIYNTTKAGLYAAWAANCVFANNIIHNMIGAFPCIQVIGGKNVRVYGNECYSSQYGVFLLRGNYPTLEDYPQDVVIELNNIHDCTYNGIYLASAITSLTAQNTRCIISNNTIVNSSSNIVVENSNNVSVIGNIISGGTVGVQITSSKNTIISNNQCMNMTYSGFYLKGATYITLSGNRAFAYIDTNNRGIVFDEIVSDNIIAYGNYFEGSLANVLKVITPTNLTHACNVPALA